MRIGSLFSGGCGGLDLGLERAGVGHVVWQCEIDPAARRNLARHWPGVKQYTDVMEMNHGNTERVDVICGGFPCVDLSYAGKGTGLAGTRSGLWYEYLRIVRELRPRYVVLENVSALVSRGLDAVLGGLAKAGYNAVWFTLRASDVGAPHQRERLFIVAYADRQGELQQEWAKPRERGWAGDGCGDVVDALRNDAERLGRPGDVACSGGDTEGQGREWERRGDASGDSREAVHEFPPGPGDQDGWREYLARFPNRAPAVQNAKKLPLLNPIFVEALMGFPEGWTNGTRSERLKQLGNAVVPQCAEVVGRILLKLTNR